MPARTRAMIRRAINRLNELIKRYAGTYAPLVAVAGIVEKAAEKVNSTFQAFQKAAVYGDKERAERDTASGILLNWIQDWRPVVMMMVSGASENIRSLPASGATPDDIIHVAEDMQTFIQDNSDAESFRQNAQDDLGSKLEDAKKETSEAAQALPEEAAARTAYTEACMEANTVLVRGSEIVRSIFGRTSPEYKQFITRASAAGEEDEVEEEMALETEEIV